MTTTDFNHTTGRRRTIKNPTKEKKTPTTRKKRNKMTLKQKRPPKHINCRGGLMKRKRDIQSISIAEAVSGKEKTSKAYQLQRRSHEKKKRPPKHINCRGGLRKGKDFQSILLAEAVSHNQTDTAKAYQLQGQYQKQARHTRMSKLLMAETPSHVTQEKYHRNFATTRKSTHVTAEVSSGEDTNAEDIGTPHTKITETSLHTRFKMQIISMRIPTFHHKSPTEDRNHTNGEEWTATKQETLQP